MKRRYSYSRASRGLLWFWASPGHPSTCLSDRGGKSKLQGGSVACLGTGREASSFLTICPNVAPSVISPTFLRLVMGWERVKAVLKASHSPSPRNSIYRTIMPGFPPPRVAERLWENIITINIHHACLLCINQRRRRWKKKAKITHNFTAKR